MRTPPEVHSRPSVKAATVFRRHIPTPRTGDLCGQLQEQFVWRTLADIDVVRHTAPWVFLNKCRRFQGAFTSVAAANIKYFHHQRGVPNVVFTFCCCCDDAVEDSDLPHARIMAYRGGFGPE